MTINNPRLVLTFNESYPSSQTVTYQYIVYHSISIKYQLLNGLKASSNQVSLQLTKDCSAIEKIIAAENDIQAVLYNDSNVLFTGFVSTNFSWNVTDNGEQTLSITIEDVGTRLFSRPFISSGYHLFNCSVSNAVQAICDKVGITVSSQSPEVSSTITKTVDSSKSCKDIIDQMLYEVGYVYYFDNLGQLRLFKIDCTTTSSAPIWDKDDLYTKQGKAISLSKKIRQYRYARVTYTELGNASNYLIYRNTTGKDSSHPYCYFALNAGEHFDGIEIYSASEWQEETEDEFREPALLEACNAESETVKVGSNKIISVSNVTAQIHKDTGLTCTIVAAGGPYIQINAHNSVSGEKYFSRMDAYGDIVFEKSINIIRTDTGSSLENILDETVEYIHTRTLAQNHANLLSQYHQYCNSQYTFYSTTDISCGTIIRLNDNQFSGLLTDVLIIGKVVSDNNDIVQYSAIGISAFNLNKEAFHRTTSKGKANTRGADGASGAKGDKGDKGDTGEQGPQGEKGADGAKGDKGDTGSQGPKGETGATGPQGPKGEDVGKYLGAIITSSQISGLTPNTGDGILIASSSVSGYNIGSPYIWNGSAWVEQTGITPDNTSMLFAMLNDARSIDAGVMTWFSDIVSANASIHSIFSQEITMTGSGIVKSKNYSEDSSGSPTRGYKLIGEEDLIKAKGIRVVDMVASGDSVLMGSIVHPFLKTQKAVPSQSAISYTESAAYFNRKTLVADFTAKAKQYGSYEVFLGQHVAAGNTYKFYGYVFTGTVVYKGTTFAGIVVPIRDNYKEFTALLADGYSEGNGWSSYLGRAAQSPQTNYPNHVMIGNFAAEKMKDTYVLTSDSIGNYSAVFGGTTYTQRSYSQFYKPTQSMINAFSVIPVGASSLVSGGTARIGSSTFTSPFYISKGSASLMLYDSSKSVNLEVDAEYYTQLVFSSIVLASGIDGIIVGNIEPDTSGRNIGNNTPFNVVKANKVYGAVFN